VGATASAEEVQDFITVTRDVANQVRKAAKQQGLVQA
jgi:hypothetical protein